MSDRWWKGGEGMQITKDQKAAIRKHLTAFQKYLQTEQFQTDQKNRLDRVHFFQKVLPNRLADLAESDVEEVILNLWASMMWSNKAYLVQKIITENGMDSLRQNLTLLLDRSKPGASRYTASLKSLKRLGPASITEILCYGDPEHCGIWNQKARPALSILGFADVVNPKKYKLSGEEYEAFNQLLRAIADELKQAGMKEVDLLFVDFFLYEVSQSAEAPTAATAPAVVAPLSQPSSDSFDHDEIKDMVEQIGSNLGFDASTEVKITHGAKLDAVWRAQIGHLGMVMYAFEVHSKGSIDSLLLNLQKAKSHPSVQKVIAVSDDAQLEKIRRESTGLPEEFRRSLAFWSAKDVQKVAKNLEEVTTIINGLGLVQGEF